MLDNVSDISDHPSFKKKEELSVCEESERFHEFMDDVEDALDRIPDPEEKESALLSFFGDPTHYFAQDDDICPLCNRGPETDLRAV